MQRRFLILTILLLFTNQLIAQIENEIKAFVDTTEIIVNNGRKMIVSKIMEDDFVKADEIYKYLTDITSNRSYSAFYYTDDIYLNLLFCDWNNLVNILLDYENRIDKKIYPNSPYISPQLASKVVSLNDSLSIQCQMSDLDLESKKIIDLILILIKNGSNDSGYNSKLEEYNKEFPTSRYEELLDSYLPKRKLKTSIAWALGTGMVFTTGNLHKNYNPNASFNLSMDINVENIYSSLYINVAQLKLKQPFQISNSTELLPFAEGENFHYLDAGLKVGYFVLRNNKLQFSPFVSISGSSLKSKRFEPEDDEKEYKIFNSFTSGLGMHTEVKLSEFKTSNIYYSYTKSYLSLKLEGGYNFITKFNDNFFKGNTSFLTIALVWGIGDF